jgi:hypothetical protein
MDGIAGMLAHCTTEKLVSDEFSCIGLRIGASLRKIAELKNRRWACLEYHVHAL